VFVLWKGITILVYSTTSTILDYAIDSTLELILGLGVGFKLYF